MLRYLSNLISKKRKWVECHGNIHFVVVCFFCRRCSPVVLANDTINDSSCNSGNSCNRLYTVLHVHIQPEGDGQGKENLNDRWLKEYRRKQSCSKVRRQHERTPFAHINYQWKENRGLLVATSRSLPWQRQRPLQSSPTPQNCITTADHALSSMSTGEERRPVQRPTVRR